MRKPSTSVSVKADAIHIYPQYQKEIVSNKHMFRSLDMLISRIFFLVSDSIVATHARCIQNQL